ncbi:hypothetical protein H0I76_04065 [Limibaculum sp. M0105]|uniref:Uncharacterized protein n=1 Tax=Thermohalobaculum xanthum TaxID=2753746 RepID=A0A8J7M609_9RHOB|nr:DUF6477 family protein [Thermohalobaculum xanthum]MBK0398355.1 hypothetical protein [Thermohalobaculum xanthum]
MGLMQNDLATRGMTGALMVRPRLLVEAARIGARIRADRVTAPMSKPALAHAIEHERTLEGLRRAGSPVYRPSRHVEALAIVFCGLGEACAQAPDKAPAALSDQTKASGSAAFLRSM